MKGRIAIDMDEVMADALGRYLEWYERDYGIKVDRSTIVGKHFQSLVPKEHLEVTKQYLFQKGFFADLPVMENCIEVVKELHEHYEIFIVTAAMPFPHSFNEKYDWLQKHVPFIDCRHYVFCGHKYMIQADYLIDDSPRNLETFTGTPLLFTAAHNHHEDRFKRVNNWLEVKELLIG